MADDGSDNRSQRPLAGVIMCCTSIPPEQRSHLASIASEMGAINKLDLTSDVTHLIVGDTDTPKYKYVARERSDVRCLLPEWIEAVRQSWMEGGDTQVEVLELQYHLPTFAGLKVCVTGFEDFVIRKELEETINKNGGEYRGDLSKEITHLIAHTPTGNKYNAAKLWGVRVVSIEWLHQSLERGMILDESLYDPLLPPSDRGRDAWVRKQVSTSPTTKRPREEVIAPAASRKLRRTASAKFESQNDGMWTDIVGGGFEKVTYIKNEWDINNNAQTVTNVKNSFTTAPTQLNSYEERLKPESETQATPSVGRNAGDDALFKGMQFYLYSFDGKQTAVLRKHLYSHGGEIVESLAETSKSSSNTSTESRFLLVPHTLSSHSIPSILDEDVPRTMVTEMWVERCIYKKTYVQPDSHVTNAPFKHPISGFDDLIICSTTIEGIDLLHLSKIVGRLGATYDEYLTTRTSLLICNDILSTREKLRHALDWNVPIVRPEWLWDCIKFGQRLQFGSYTIHSTQQANSGDVKVEGSATGRFDLRGDFRGSQSELMEKTSKLYNRRGFKFEGADSKNDPASESYGEEIPSNTAIQNFDGPFDGFYTPHDKHPHDSAALIRPGSSRRDIMKFSSSQILNNKSEQSLDIKFLRTSSNRPRPLNELCPNSPVKPISPPKTSPAKSVRPISSHQNTESLSTEISSLLAHHQREQSNPPPLLRTESSTLGRRKRQLFGRAPSNLSAQNISLSRASSVDTMNTDGLGTPLEASHPTATSLLKNKDANAKKLDCKNSITASVLATYLENDDHFHEDEEAKQKLQMTQLGYEDPEAEVWRQKLTRKMGAVGGGKEEKGGAVEVRIKSSRVTVKDDVGIRGQSVSTRTRRAGR